MRILFAALIISFIAISCKKPENLVLDYTTLTNVEQASGDTISMMAFPNTITPDQDGINDFFLVYASGIDNEETLIQIHNQTGNVLFSTTDIYTVWDGKFMGTMVSSGQYAVHISALDSTGYEYEFLHSLQVIR